jgi:hypothetical protein
VTGNQRIVAPTIPVRQRGEARRRGADLQHRDVLRVDAGLAQSGAGEKLGKRAEAADRELLPFAVFQRLEFRIAVNLKLHEIGDRRDRREVIVQNIRSVRMADVFVAHIFVSVAPVVNSGCDMRHRRNSKDRC